MLISGVAFALPPVGEPISQFNPANPVASTDMIPDAQCTTQGCTRRTNPDAIAIYVNAHNALTANSIVCNPTGSTAFATACNALPPGFGVSASALSGTLPGGVSTNVFSALAYGGTWSTTGDAAIGINGAANAACSAGGGDVIWPASPSGGWSIQTPIPQTCPGVHLKGAGIGAGAATSYTQLKWTAPSDPGVPLLDVGPTSGQGYSEDVTGIAVDGNNIANECVRVKQVSRSKFDVGGANCLHTNVHFTTLASGGTSQGLQDNDISAYSNSSNCASGIVFDGAGTTWNPSINRIHLLYTNFNCGDGVVFGFQDNNAIDDIRGFASVSGATGRPAVVANSAYTPPSGFPLSGTIGVRGRELLFKSTHVPVAVLGGQTGATLVANSGNTGSAAVATVGPFTTTGAPGTGQNQLTFTSNPSSGSPNVAIGMVANCTAPSPFNSVASPSTSGVPLNDPVFAPPTSSTVGLLEGFTGSLVNTLSQPWGNTVPAGTTCLFSFGVQNSAVGNSVYNVGYFTSTPVTAPFGGSFTASISGTTLTVTGTPTGVIAVGQQIVSGSGVTANTTILALGTGAGGAGTYTVNNSQTVGSESMTSSSCPNSGYCVAAPAGGSTQSGLSLTANSVLKATDVVIPFLSTGVPNSGDYFILTVPQPSYNVAILGVDANNNVPLGFFENVAGGITAFTSQAIPFIFSNGATGVSLCFMDQQPCAQPSGTDSVLLGANPAVNPGQYSFYAGGQGNQCKGFGCFVSGIQNMSNGTVGAAGGFQATEQARYGASAWASGDINAVGDAQTVVHVLRGSVAAPSGTVVLTSDGTGINTHNCVNLNPNSGYNITMDITAIDHTTPANVATWNGWTGLLTEGAAAANAAVATNTKPTPLTTGTTTGVGIAATVDATTTTGGCLKLTFTAGSGGTDVWDAVAKVTTVEVQ